VGDGQDATMQKSPPRGNRESWESLLRTPAQRLTPSWGWPILTTDLDGKISIALEKLSWLDGETDGNLSTAFHNLEDVIAEQTAVIAPDSLLRNQLEPAVSSFALRTSDVGFSHVANEASPYRRGTFPAEFVFP
jgi:hypothetical protein